MILCNQCYYTFKVTDKRVLTNECPNAPIELEGSDIIIECPRCKGQMLFEYCKAIPQGEIEQ